MNPFQVLGVSSTASSDEIKAAYRRQAQVLHPDRHVGADATVGSAAHEAFCRLNDAYAKALYGRTSRSDQPTPAVPTVPTEPTVPRQPARPGRPAAATRTAAPGSPVADWTDAMLGLLAVPHLLGGGWSTEEVDYWVDVVLPEARGRVPRALVFAAAAGARDDHTQAVAMAHLLITRCLAGKSGRVAASVRDRVQAVYPVLEVELPASLRATLAPKPVAHERSTRSVGGFSVLAVAALAAGFLIRNGDFLHQLVATG